MPVPMLKSLAARHGINLATVEGYWNECKATIKPVKEAKPGGRPSYGTVVNCVKAKCANRGVEKLVTEKVKQYGIRK